ncbi:polymorphic toxin type 44 domain-containing protein [Nocardia sp. NPDC057227]|uniref:polymorphic toxin type 44 domain-containing protein n=1 Tax=Nocardia sp. NPDC057227 TaxID=3346056 RepID=UPI00363845DE
MRRQLRDDRGRLHAEAALAGLRPGRRAALMPTRSELDRWDIDGLRVWATEIRAGTTSYGNELRRMNTHFADTQWLGKAADAAGERIAEYVDEGRKLGIENGEFADALDAAAGRLESERNIVRARVGDVENDRTTAATFIVGDTWLVDLDTLEAPIDAKNPRFTNIPARHRAHQDAIDTALHGLDTAIDEFSTVIATNAQEIRARGNQFGAGNSRASAASPQTAQQVGAARAELDRLVAVKYAGTGVDPITGEPIDNALDRARHEYSKWRQLADTQMNLDDYTESEKRFTRAEEFIFDEMKTNIASTEVARMSQLNEPHWWQVVLPPAVDQASAASLLYDMVEVGGPWDHKPILEEKLGLSADNDYYFKDPSQNRAVFYDIYSNIHYGYVGRAAGFPEETLLAGANLGTGATGVSDAGDDITMRIGVQLYERYGSDLTQAQLHEGIEQAMNEMDSALSSGKPTTQIRVTQ